MSSPLHSSAAVLDTAIPEAGIEDAGAIIGERSGNRNEDFVARAAIAAVFIFLAVYTWGRWGNIQIDCGREVYVPVEMLKGRMLYRDVWYPYGPLVPYLQAVLVWIFGVHLNSFYVAGLILSLSIAYLVYGLARRLLPAVPSAVVSIVCLRQGFGESIFNYVFPYSYAAVVGLVLGLLSIYFLFQYVDTRDNRKLVFAGLASGLALLSKHEFGAAALAAIGFMMVWDFVESRSVRTLFRQAMMIAPGVLLAALVYGWFLWRLTPDFMLRENFSLSPNSPFMKTIGPRWIAEHGFQFVPSQMRETFASVVFSIGVWFLGAQVFSVTVKNRWMLPVSGFLLILVLIGGGLPFDKAQIPYGLSLMVTFPAGMYWIAPLILVAAAAGLLGREDRSTREVIGILTVFAMAMASRVMFKTIRVGYSVYYDPALFIVFMIAVTATLWFGAQRLLRTDRLHLINCFLIVDAVWFLLVPFPTHINEVPVETPIGKIFTHPAEAILVPEMISFVRAQAAAGKRVLILPEFPMLYAMTGTESASRWYELVPGMLDSADEKQLTADAESQHVEYVIVTNRSTFEYGYPYFGIDWGKDIYRWIDNNFEQSGEFGKFERRIDAPFSALIYKRRSVPVANQPRVLNQ
jgi:hypothetical protein